MTTSNTPNYTAPWDASKSALSSNGKTCKSLDLNTECPKRAAGNPCSYCYVEGARSTGICAKLVYRTRYTGEVARLRERTVAKLQACGGLRIFSFGDYDGADTTDADLQAALDDCAKRNLPTKAITKVADFVEKYHDKVDVIHVSVDNVGDGMDWNLAKSLRDRFSNVYIRTVITQDSDLQALDFADLHTLHHSQRVSKHGYKNFSHAEVTDLAAARADICCGTRRCWSCPTKCTPVRKVD